MEKIWRFLKSLSLVAASNLYVFQRTLNMLFILHACEKHLYFILDAKQWHQPLALMFVFVCTERQALFWSVFSRGQSWILGPQLLRLLPRSELLTIWGNAFAVFTCHRKRLPLYPPSTVASVHCSELPSSRWQFQGSCILPSTDISHWFSHQPVKTMTLSLPSVWPWLSGGSYIHPFIFSCVTSCEYGKNLLYLCHGCSVFRNPGESV